MMMGWLSNATIGIVASASIATAEPFREVTVGIPVSSIADAEPWYLNFFGADTEVMQPFPGVVEFKVAPNTWVQIFEVENHQPTGAVVRFFVDDMAAAQSARAERGIDTGEAIDVPDVVTYAEFKDPFGNALGFYDLP